MRDTPERVAGFPPSGNGASSFHLWWEPAPHGTAVEVTLRVEWEPPVDRLCFWALQASFSQAGRHLGAAHLGLQWNPRYPGRRAVNFGGYAAAGGVLDGSTSPLPSTPGDPNTRDLLWEPGVEYRLRIEPSPDPGWWSGVIEGVGKDPIEVRRLRAGGDRLESPVVWSEIFARCDDPSVAVRWSDPRILTGEHGGVEPHHYRVNYQSFAGGGCTNTSVRPVEGAVIQETSVDRVVPQGVLVPVG